MTEFPSLPAPTFDERGFLEDPDWWNRDLALGIAAGLGIGELTESHWRVVDQLRSHYLTNGSLPVERTLCRELDLASTCVTALFGGLMKAWMVAGLPNPGEEARIYMENMEPRQKHRSGQIAGS